MFGPYSRDSGLVILCNKTMFTSVNPLCFMVKKRKEKKKAFLCVLKKTLILTYDDKKKRLK